MPHRSICPPAIFLLLFQASLPLFDAPSQVVAISLSQFISPTPPSVVCFYLSPLIDLIVSSSFIPPLHRTSSCQNRSSIPLGAAACQGEKTVHKAKSGICLLTEEQVSLIDVIYNKEQQWKNRKEVEMIGHWLWEDKCELCSV